MDNNEKKKIHEIMSKKDESKIDWMYKGSQPDTDEYLLGRKIDKYIENVPEPAKEEKYGAAFSERIKANIELDMAAKMREDPLFQIRKREEEARRRILDNPVKMRQIQKMIKEQKEDRKKSKSKKSKKDKKHKSRDEDSDQSGDELMKTYLSIINKKHLGKSDDGDRRPQHEDKKRFGYGLQKHHRDRDEEYSSRRDNHSRYSHRQDDYTHKGTSSEHTSKHSFSSRGRSNASYSHHHQSSYRRRSRSRSPQYSRSRSPQYSRSRSPQHSRSRSPQARGRLNESEREKKLREMMDNAKWRDGIRQKNMKRYEEECEEEERTAKKGSSSDFLNPMMSQHADQSSVEERIKRNKYNIQRTKMQLNSNFNKR